METETDWLSALCKISPFVWRKSVIQVLNDMGHFGVDCFFKKDGAM